MQNLFNGHLPTQHSYLVLQRVLLAPERLFVDALDCHNVFRHGHILGHIHLRKGAAVRRVI